MHFRLKVLIELYFLITFVTVFQSCCHYDLVITPNGYVNAWQLSVNNQRVDIDTINGEFYLEFYFMDSIYTQTNPNLINSCYAMSCGENYHNNVEYNSVSLFADEPIIFKGTTLPEGTNLLSVANSGIEKNITYSGGWFRYKFSKEFLNNTKFTNDSITFKFNALTDNKLILTKEINLKTVNGNKIQ